MTLKDRQYLQYAIPLFPLSGVVVGNSLVQVKMRISSILIICVFIQHLSVCNLGRNVRHKGISHIKREQWISKYSKLPDNLN